MIHKYTFFFINSFIYQCCLQIQINYFLQLFKSLNFNDSYQTDRIEFNYKSHSAKERSEFISNYRETKQIPFAYCLNQIVKITLSFLYKGVKKTVKRIIKRS